MDELELETLTRALKSSEENLKVTLAKQSAEIKQFGETTEKTAKSIKAAEDRLDQVVADIGGLSKKAVEELTEQLTEAKARIDELEKKGQRPGWEGLGVEEMKSPGETFIASEELKRALEAKKRETETVSIKSLFRFHDTKSAFLSDAATRMVQPFRTDMVTPQLRRLRIRDLLPVRPTSSNAIEYLEEIGFAVSGAATGTQTHGAAAATAEGAAFPETQIELELKTTNVKDVGHWIAASRQILTDMPMLQSYIDDRLIFGVSYEEEVQLLYGDGAGNNLQGIMTHPNRQTYAWSAGETGDTKIDALRRAATKAHVREYMPTGAVVNPNDWEDIELAKGSDGHYIWFRVASGTEERLFRLPVVVTNAMQSADALVGSFAIGAVLWDREDASVRLSEHHQDFFTRKLVAILADERIALQLHRPDSFVDVNFDSAPA